MKSNFWLYQFQKCLFHKLFEDLLCGQHWIIGETKEIENRSINHGSHAQGNNQIPLLVKEQ